MSFQDNRTDMNQFVYLTRNGSLRYELIIFPRGSGNIIRSHRRNCETAITIRGFHPVIFQDIHKKIVESTFHQIKNR